MTHLGIDWEDWGNGPAVLVLHGVETTENFRGPLSPLVDAGYRVILARPLPAPEGTRQAVGLLNALGIGRVVCLGIGEGGSVLADLLKRHPGRVAAGSLILSREGTLQFKEGGSGLPEALKKGLDAHEGTVDPQVDPATGRPKLMRLRAWAEGVRSRACGWRDLRSRLRGLQLPPLLEEGMDEEEVLTDPA